VSNVPTNLIPTTVTGLPEYTGSSTLGYLPYVVEGRTYKVQFSNIAAVGAVPSSRTIATGTGLTGGGDLSADRTIAIANGGVGTAQLAASGVSAGVYGSGTLVPVLTVDATGRVTSATTAAVSVSGFVPTSRSVIAGTGLTGGGALTSDVTLNVNFSSSTPQALGTATAGVSTAAARGDHVHPAVNLADTSQTQGALPLGRGGTGDALSPVAGAVVYSTGTRFALTALGLPGQVLMSDGANAPQWATVSGIGTVTSVNVSGGTTGLTFSGGPVTAAGTITMAGTLAVGNGGTGLTTLAANFVPKGNGTAAFSASQIFDDGTNVGIGTASPGTKLDVNGTTRSGNFRVNAGGTVTGAGMWGIDTILAFNTGSTERMRIDSVGNVGIGTASAANKLVVSNAGANGFEFDPATGILQTYNRATSLYTGLLAYALEQRFFTGTSPTEKMRITSGGELCVGRTSSLNTGVLSVLGTGTQAITTQVTVDGNSLIQGYNSSTGLAFQVLGTGQGYYAGNLGIGTTSPAARIHTNGGAGGINGVFESNTAADTRIEFRNNATRAGYLYWDANEVRLLADPTRSLTSYTNGVERMRIDNAGNVGIGTTSPTLLFQVGSRGGMSSSGIFQWGSALTGNNRGVLSWDTNTAIIGTPQNLVFCANTETTERMRLDSSGNLGVGTSPDARLWVLSPSGASLRIGFNATSVNYYDAATQIFRGSNGGTELMRLTSTGRLGIGASSPEATLVVAGTAGSIAGAGLAVSETSTGNSARLRIVQSAGFVTYDATYSTGGNQQVWSNAGVERMRLTEAGLVGIGTAAPQNLLHLESASPVIRLRDTDAAAGVYSTISGDNTTGSILISADSANAAASSAIAFLVDGSERARISSVGDVGIGTSSPAVYTGYTTLDIDNATNGGLLNIKKAGTTVGYLNGASGMLLLAQSNDLKLTATGATSTMQLSTNATERMRVKANGQVRFIPLAAAPGSPEAGDVYYDSTTNKLRCYNGTTWNDLF
jgi:hypothetical protein